MKKVIENIGKKVLDLLFDTDKNDIDYDGSLLYGNCTVLTCKAEFDINKTSVTCHVRYEDDKLSYCEVEVYRKDRDYENVQRSLQQYLDENFDECELKNVIEDELASRVSYDEPCMRRTHANTGVGYRLGRSYASYM